MPATPAPTTIASTYQSSTVPLVTLLPSPPPVGMPAPIWGKSTISAVADEPSDGTATATSCVDPTVGIGVTGATNDGVLGFDGANVGLGEVDVDMVVTVVDCV